MKTRAIESYTNAATDYLSLQEAKDELRVIGNDDDALILRYIKAAVHHLSQHLGYSVRKASVAYYFNNTLYGKLHIPARLISITSVKYRNSSNALVALASGTDYHAPVEFISPYGTDIDVITEAATTPDYDWIYKVTAVEGFEKENTSGNASNILPEDLKGVIANLVTHYYQNRMPVVIGTISSPLPYNFESILFPYRILEVI